MLRRACLVVTVLGLTSCTDRCPSESWCEGDVVVRCQYSCESSANGLPKSCGRKLTKTDCAAVGQGAFDVAQTCHEFAASSGPIVTCVDAPATTCSMQTPAVVLAPGVLGQVPLACSVTGKLKNCQGVGPEGLVTTTVCGSGLRCLSVEAGRATCIDEPAVACDAGAFPRCTTGAVQRCVGSGDAGTFVLTEPCGSNPNFTIECQVQAGEPKCVSTPVDGGP